MRRIGFLINPIAGMGGRVGLKGTDGVVEEARALGAEPRAHERAERALEPLSEAGESVELVTWGEPMGESIAVQTNLPVTIAGSPDSSSTDADDTKAAARAFIEHGVDVIVFAGGDGTAVDIAEVIEDTGASTPILGIPAGVKIFSSVFAVSPEAAGEIAILFDRTEDREVADLDEDAYRSGRVQSALRAVVPVPVADDVQASKQQTGGSVEGVAAGVVAGMDPETTYFLGPGSTVGAVKEALGISGSPLGVDIVRAGELIEADVSDAALRRYLNGNTVIIVSPIGGQGFVFGRGNHQFSPPIIRESGIEIIASRSKLDQTGVLRVDTGDPDLDADLRGWTKVRIGRVEQRMMEIV